MKPTSSNFYKVIVLILLCFMANVDFAVAENVVAGSNVMPIGAVFAKFGITMAAVGVSLLIIWGSLTLFKMYVKQQFEQNRQKVLSEESNPKVKNIDDAIISFINKNKL